MKESKIKKTIFAIVRLNARFTLKHSIVYWNENYYMQENEFLISEQQD